MPWEKSVHEFILLHEWPFSQSMRSPKRAADYCIVFSFAFFLLEYIDTVPFFSLESPEVYDTGKCTEFDRKLLNSFIMNDVI